MKRTRLRVARESDVTEALKRQSALYLQRAHDAEAKLETAEQRAADMEKALRDAKATALAFRRMEVEGSGWLIQFVDGRLAALSAREEDPR